MQMQEKFDLDISLDHIKNGIDFQMNKIYRDFRYRLHTHFISHGGDTSLTLAKQNKPFRVSQSDWEYLCDYFCSDEYKVNTLPKLI